MCGFEWQTRPTALSSSTFRRRWTRACVLFLDFGKEVQVIADAMSRERTSILFSTTTSFEVGNLQRARLRDPEKVAVSDKQGIVDTLLQDTLFVPEMQKTSTSRSCSKSWQLCDSFWNTRKEHAQRNALRCCFELFHLRSSYLCWRSAAQEAGVAVKFHCP